MIPVYEVDIEMEGWESGMTAISLVSKPAIQRSFVALNEQEEKPTFKFADEEKRQIVGPIMVPDKLIYRKSERMGEYYLRFTKEGIEKIMAKWSKNGMQNWFNLEHSIAIGTDSAYILEYWIKESENDKSKDYGFDDPIGTAFVKLQVVSDLIWEDVKQNQLTGFSIEIDSNLIKTKEEMTENLKFAVEMGERFAKLESEISSLKNTIEVLMSALEEKEEVQEAEEKLEEAAEEVAEEVVAEEEAVEEEAKEEVKEELSEETTEETSVEAAELKLSEEQEGVEAEKEVDKTVKFEGITPRKISMINSFLGKPRY
jgi:flagellar biosynthesis GTPase FlhF